jgi:hypothetical protein
MHGKDKLTNMEQPNTPPLSQEVLKQIQDWAAKNAETEQTTFDETRYCGLVDGAYEWATRCAQMAEALKETRSVLNWMWENFRPDEGKEYLQSDAFNRPANALTIADDALAAWTGMEDTKPYDRLESGIQGKAAIAFYEWMQNTSMTQIIPLEIKYRMFADQQNAKQQTNKTE